MGELNARLINGSCYVRNKPQADFFRWLAFQFPFRSEPFPAPDRRSFPSRVFSESAASPSRGRSSSSSDAFISRPGTVPTRSWNVGRGRQSPRIRRQCGPPSSLDRHKIEEQVDFLVQCLGCLARNLKPRFACLVVHMLSHVVMAGDTIVG